MSKQQSFWDWSKDISFINRFLFPAPKPSSYTEEFFPDELIWVPPKEKLHEYKVNSISKETEYKYADPNAIPCLFLRGNERSRYNLKATHLMIYLHGNAEDLGKTYPIIDYMRHKLTINIIAPEYPGYGIFDRGDNCFANETTVTETVHNLYEFVISPYGLNFPINRIIIYGFSIGSGAALSLHKINVQQLHITKKYTKYSKPFDVKDKDKDEKKRTGAKNRNPYLNKANQMFSSFLTKCKHNEIEHYKMFGVKWKNAHFTPSSKPRLPHSDAEPSKQDPFGSLPLVSLLNILRKGGVSYGKGMSKQELVALGRRKGLIPRRQVCIKANRIRKYALMVIVCPFTSITQVIADKVGAAASWLISDRFDNSSAMESGKLDGPILIIHGKNDTIIPYQHSQKLYEKANAQDINCKVEILEGCDHNSMCLKTIANTIMQYFKTNFNLAKNASSNYHAVQIEIPDYARLKPRHKKVDDCPNKNGAVDASRQKEEEDKGAENTVEFERMEAMQMEINARLEKLMREQLNGSYVNPGFKEVEVSKAVSMHDYDLFDYQHEQYGDQEEKSIR